eukprot:5747013-Prymnesium_polylepis.2
MRRRIAAALQLMQHAPGARAVVVAAPHLTARVLRKLVPPGALHVVRIRAREQRSAPNEGHFGCATARRLTRGEACRAEAVQAPYRIPRTANCCSPTSDADGR